MSKKHAHQMIYGMQTAMSLYVIYAMLFVCPFAFIGYPGAIAGFALAWLSVKNQKLETISD